MFTLNNRLPQASIDFPKSWIEEFRQELNSANLARIQIVTTALLLIEILLLLVDTYRTRWFETGFDALATWRIVALLFLLSYRFTPTHWLPERVRLQIFLVLGMLLSTSVSTILANSVGDISTFTIGVLGLAAASPMPGRFNSTLFTTSGVGLLAWLYYLVPGFNLFWASNILATCVIGIAIDQLIFKSALLEFSQRKNIDLQRQRLDELLCQVFPKSVALALKTGQRSVALHGEVTILFADVVGFTRLSKQLLPSQLVQVLEDLFGIFDRLAKQHGVEKVKTIGDAYMAIAGAPETIDHPVQRMANFSLDIVQACRDYAQSSGMQLAVRVGIHTGPVVAGVIGSSRLGYDLWGDSVNTAQRMQTSSEPNAICVSEPVFFKLRGAFTLDSRQVVDLKGSGPTRTYVLRARRQETQEASTEMRPD